MTESLILFIFILFFWVKMDRRSTCISMCVCLLLVILYKSPCQTPWTVSSPDSTNWTQTPPQNPTALQVTLTWVLKALKQVNPHKAVGPDGASPGVLKVCAEELAGVYADVFNLCLTQAAVLHIFKSLIITPVPQKPDTSTLENFRPVSLTVKCLEKLVLTLINSLIPDTAEPLQFAYSPNRSVDDVVAMIVHLNTSTAAECMQGCSCSWTTVRLSVPSDRQPDWETDRPWSS